MCPDGTQGQPHPRSRWWNFAMHPLGGQMISQLVKNLAARALTVFTLRLARMAKVLSDGLKNGISTIFYQEFYNFITQKTYAIEQLIPACSKAFSQNICQPIPNFFSSPSFNITVI
jgi:hypothetical protein